jgi:hypothetical protein
MKEEDKNNMNSSHDEELKEEKAEEQEIVEQEEAIKAIKKFTDEDEDEDGLGEISLRSIIGGDILQSHFMQHQVLFFMFIVVLALIYTGNRYASQKEALLIDSLKIQLQEERYKVLTIESELLNASRQSEIVKQLKANGDSLLLNTTTPPFEIKKKRD